jgi:NADH:ubiquinone oxidoreductase subunit 5 (subunit L)/multisubunit Na+/H+ antiporter MnhA subunit
MAAPLMVLCLGSIFSGYFLKGFFVELGVTFFKQSLTVNEMGPAAELIPLWAKLIPTIFSLFGVFFALFFCRLKRKRLFFFEEKGFRGVVFRVSRYIFRFLVNR